MSAKYLLRFGIGVLVPLGCFIGTPDITSAQRYRMILPPAPKAPPPLNNTVQSQIANQNINFNTGSSVSGGTTGIGGGGGFNQNTGGVQGTAQFTQNNAPGMQISQLYQIPLSTGGGAMGGGGGFGQGGGFGGGVSRGASLGRLHNSRDGPVAAVVLLSGFYRCDG